MCVCACVVVGDGGGDGGVDGLDMRASQQSHTNQHTDVYSISASVKTFLTW